MLTDNDRLELYEALRDRLGERPATLFMSTVSPHDPDEVATKADLRELRIEMREMFNDQFHRMFWANVGTMIALVGLVLAAQSVN